MTKIGASQRMAWIVLALSCFSVIAADDADEAMLRLRDKVVSAAWKKAGDENPTDMIVRTKAALKIADDYRKRNATRTTDDDKKKQPAYESAYKYLDRRAQDLEAAVEILTKFQNCTLTVKHPGDSKTSPMVVQKLPEPFTADDIRKHGDIRFIPNEKGDLSPAPDTPGEKAKDIKNLVEINFFYPAKESPNGQLTDEPDTTRYGIGIKETVYPTKDQDEHGTPIPAVNFASQTTATSLSQVTLLGFGPSNQYQLHCE